MTFQESLNYLLSLGNEVSAMKLGLENIRALLAALGDPQNNFLKVQVAGTNGKGSTCVFLDSICRQTNIQTGLYTSPHLVSITERIKINGEEISEENFARFATAVRETAENEFDTPPTFFEQVTAIALLAFAESTVELGILETGLGGRLDATTATNAEINAITPIDYDHQKYLGDTIEEIAAEKAAIIHERSRVFVAPQQPEVETIIRERCKRVGVVPEFVDGELEPAIKLEMRGRHQIVNASLAKAVAESLDEFGFTATRESIVKGLESAVNAGRLEYFGEILFDGAHNPGGARALADYLSEFIDTPITLIFGAMEDKNIAEIAKILFPLANKLVLTAVGNTRSARPESLLKLVPAAFPKDNVFSANTSAEGLEKAKSVTAGDGLICVTGSLYLVGEVQKILKERL